MKSLAPGGVWATVRVRETRQSLSCPLCRSDLEELAQACSDCGTRYHEACLEELGGCSTLGCSKKGVARGSIPSEGQSSRWGRFFTLLLGAWVLLVGTVLACALYVGFPFDEALNWGLLCSISALAVPIAVGLEPDLV